MKTCIVCGTEFSPKAHNVKMCSKECRIKRQMMQNSMRYKENRARIAQEKNAKASKGGNRPPSIPQVLDLARKAGMSYGKYVAMQKIAL